MHREPEVAVIEPVAVRRKTTAAMLDCSESTVHKLIREGQLDTVKVGADLRVTVESIRRFAAGKAAA